MVQNFLRWQKEHVVAAVVTPVSCGSEAQINSSGGATVHVFELQARLRGDLARRAVGGAELLGLGGGRRGGGLAVIVALVLHLRLALHLAVNRGHIRVVRVAVLVVAVAVRRDRRGRAGIKEAPLEHGAVGAARGDDARVVCQEAHAGDVRRVAAVLPGLGPGAVVSSAAHRRGTHPFLGDGKRNSLTLPKSSPVTMVSA